MMFSLCKETKLSLITLSIWLFVEGIAASESCGVGITRGGCFEKAGGSLLDTLLVNDRDGSSGHHVNWHDYYGYLKSLSCRCGQVALSKGYFTFGIQFYGECWGTKTKIHDLVSKLKSSTKDCLNKDYKACQPTNEFCGGTDKGIYLYRIASSAPIDGGYTEWSEWSTCTQSCGGGFQERYRTCTKPRPKNGGKSCENKGVGEEERKCNTDDCPNFNEGGCSMATHSPSIDLVNASSPFIFGSSSRFCRVIMNQRGKNDNSYRLQVDLFNAFSARGASYGNPGVIFNAKDMSNFQFIYFKLSSYFCYVTSVMKNGMIDYNPKYYSSEQCQFIKLVGKTWISVYIKVTKSKARIYANGYHIVTVPSHQPTLARGGYIVRNGEENIVYYKNYRIY